MFTNHNIPKSLLNDVSNFCVENKHNYNLPQEFVEAAKSASLEYRNAINLEDRKNVIMSYLNETVKKSASGINAQYIMNEFERAVVGFANDSSIVGNVSSNNDESSTEETVLSEEKTAKAERDTSSKDRKHYVRMTAAIRKAKENSGRTTREGHGKPAEKDTEVTRKVGGKDVKAIIPKGVRPVDKKDDSKEYAKLDKAPKAAAQVSSSKPAMSKSDVKAARKAADLKRAEENRKKSQSNLGDKKTETQSYVPDASIPQLDEDFINTIVEMTDSEIDEFVATLSEEELTEMNSLFESVEQNQKNQELVEHLSSLTEEEFDKLLSELSEDQVNTLMAALEIGPEEDDDQVESEEESVEENN